MLLAIIIILVFVAQGTAQTSEQCCWSKPRSCAELLKSGKYLDGVYYIYPLREDHPVDVYCDMTTDGGGWTVFQKRFNGEVNFTRNWTDYKTGFGWVSGEYWWGNDKIHQMTSQEPHILRVDLSDFDNNTRYAEYSHFVVSVAQSDYRASIGVYSGNAGNALGLFEGMRFSTIDTDNDVHGTSHCAQVYKGGWWYSACHASNLNGKYLGGFTTEYATGMVWQPWRGHHYSLKTTEMKLRPANFIVSV